MVATAVPLGEAGVLAHAIVASIARITMNSLPTND